MAAYAALVSLMNNIEQMMNHHRLSNFLDKKQMKPLLQKAAFLLDFMEENNYGGGSKEAEDLEREIACAAHAAEDVIESHIVDQIDGGTSLGSSLNLQQIIEDMDAVMKKATDLKEKRESREEQPTQSRARLMETGESSSSTAMVGLDDELIQLLDELTGQQSSRNIISVVGMGGMGKTTLAKNVYENLLIKEHFQFRAWATISEQYDARKILSQLLSGLGQSSGGTVDSLGEQLHKTLSGRRYLIILDDIWSVGAWDKVRRFFPDNRNRSRVVLTTRLSNVANDCLSSSIMNMKLLDEDKSWKLFCENALFPQKDDPSQLEDVGREIVRSCKGLALSIVVIGGLLLKEPRTVGYWEGVAKDIKSIRGSKEKQQSLDALSLSYSHLPPHLKPCFLYVGVFKEDSEIRVSNIIKLWVAEGFIKGDCGRVSEEIAESYLKDLIDRNLILVGKLRKNGKIGSFGIHDLLRDLCLKVAEKQQFFHVTGGDQRGRERRLICNMNPRIENLLARSIITWQFHMTPRPVDYRLVRVWYEDGNHKSPEELYRNVNLRCLYYKHPNHKQPLWELPSSISLIWNLQTLIIERYLLKCPVIVAPIEIWKMRQLRHVECYQIYIPSNSGEDDELLILENLRTLKTAVNLRLSEEVCKIISNIKKLHLVYDAELHGYDDSLIECLCNLGLLHKLESLNLKIKTSRWLTPDSEMNMKLRFPSWLNKLSLSYCQLHWDDLRMIGSLPHLQVLSLGFRSVTKGERWSPIDGQFLRLKFMKIHNCDLRYWDADSSHFPVLEKLILEQMIFLKEIPMDMSEIPTLKLIRVDRCRNSAAVSAVKIKEYQLENEENDGLQIQVKISDSDPESFKETLETEGLTMDNILLETRSSLKFKSLPPAPQHLGPG